MAQTDADPAVSVDSGFAFEIRSDGPKVVIHDKVVPYPSAGALHRPRVTWSIALLHNCISLGPGRW